MGQSLRFCACWVVFYDDVDLCYGLKIKLYLGEFHGLWRIFFNVELEVFEK